MGDSSLIPPAHRPINVASIGSNVLVQHIGCSLVVNADCQPGTMPNGQQGVRITRTKLHCQEHDIDLLSIPMP